MRIEFADHYAIRRIETVDHIRDMFPTGKADSMNWFFANTEGVHGSSNDLDEIHEFYTDGPGEDPYYPGEVLRTNDLTVLIVQPRLCVLSYGNVVVEETDIIFLRGLVESTAQAIELSQRGNFPIEEVA